MAKRTLDFSDYEEPTWEEYTGEDPPPNKWFTGRVTRGRYLEEDDQMMFIVEITEGDFAGWGKAVYCPFQGERKFVFQELVKALQGGKAQPVTIDWENEKAVDTWLKKQKAIKFKTREYNGDIKVGKTRANLEVVSGTAAPAKDVAPEPEVDDSDGDDDPYTADELEGMETSELEEILVDEFEIPKDDEDFPKKSRRDKDGSKYKTALIELILEEQENSDEDGDGEFDDGFDDSEPEPEPEPEPAPRTRRTRATKAAPAASTATRRRR